MTTLPIWPPLSGQELAASTPEWILEDLRSCTLLDEIEQMTPSDAAVLISGEIGTGKELIARYLHNRSMRRGGLFVVVSCGAFSDTLVDAEFFGHENDAFAGAFGTQVGWFEQANGGTIFLDEVNDLSLPVQSKLLRALQEREIVRLSGHTLIPVDLRIIAAITVDLETLAREKRSRKDLYHRLNVANLNVLTLKERPGDIVPLARYFINICSKRLGHARVTLTPTAERLLTQSLWHGNAHELESVIHRTLLLYDGSIIDAPELRLSDRSACAQAQTGTDPPTACAIASIT